MGRQTGRLASIWGDRRGDWHQYGETDGETGINMGRPTGRLASIWGDRRGDWHQYGETDGETGINMGRPTGRLASIWGDQRGDWHQYGETDGETGINLSLFFVSCHNPISLLSPPPAPPVVFLVPSPSQPRQTCYGCIRTIC